MGGRVGFLGGWGLNRAVLPKMMSGDLDPIGDPSLRGTIPMRRIVTMRKKKITEMPREIDTIDTADIRKNMKEVFVLSRSRNDMMEELIGSKPRKTQLNSS